MTVWQLFVAQAVWTEINVTYGFLAVVRDSLKKSTGKKPLLKHMEASNTARAISLRGLAKEEKPSAKTQSDLGDLYRFFFGGRVPLLK